MKEIRIIVYLTFAIIIALVILSGLLIFFDRGGSAEFEIFGQRFASTNIGLAILFLAIAIFIYIIRDIYRSQPIVSPKRREFITSSEDDRINWDEIIDGAQNLVLQLTSSTGFRPDLVVGICGGGLIAADIVSKRLGHIPCLAVWPNRHTSKNASKFSGHADAINQTNFDSIISDNKIKRVLVIDDVVYSGQTLKAAVEYISKCSSAIQDGDAEVRSAAIFALATSEFRPDFFAITHAHNRKMMPVSDRLR